MRTAIFIPPLPRESGGVNVLKQLGGHLYEAGFEVVFVVREGPADEINGVPAVLWDDMKLDQNTIWLVPEGWPNALAPGFQAGSRCFVYVQNWAFMLSALPHDTNWNQLPVQFLAVSDPVAWYIELVTGKDADILRPGIDLELFHPSSDIVQNPGKAVKGTVRVAWMPRKNKGMARQIRQTVEGMMAVRGINTKISWIEIEDRTPKEVAEILRSSHLYLATGFPEGLALPPLEAMASGCLVAGFGGLGGFDYMRQAFAGPTAYTPWWPLRDVPWGGNGFYAADADVPGAAECFLLAMHCLTTGGLRLADIRRQVTITANEYSIQNQYDAVVGLWKAFE